MLSSLFKIPQSVIVQHANYDKILHMEAVRPLQVWVGRNFPLLVG